jgi:hypothetical protein
LPLTLLTSSAQEHARDRPDGSFYPSNSHITRLTTTRWQTLFQPMELVFSRGEILGNRHTIWLVNFYEPGDQSCRSGAAKFEQAAKILWDMGLLRNGAAAVAAVNCEKSESREICDHYK